MIAAVLLCTTYTCQADILLLMADVAFHTFQNFLRSTLDEYKVLILYIYKKTHHF